MTLNLILAAFGGGMFGALIGALPAFIFTGFLVIAGLMMGPEGVDVVGGIAFGPFGPHISFAGGVAAAAFSHRKGDLDAGGNILAPLAKFNDPAALLVGGVFGTIGAVINYFLAGVIALPTDTVALTVVLSGIIARLVFGRTGLTGKCDDDKRVYFPAGSTLTTLTVYGFGIGLLSSYLAVEFNLVVLGFGISAATLIFAQAGFEVPATHQISLIAALAAVGSGSILIGGVFGILSNLLCDAFGKTFNSYCDSHIDPPAGAIFIMTFVTMFIW